MHERDRRTDTQTDTGPRERPRLGIASRGKNYFSECWAPEFVGPCSANTLQYGLEFSIGRTLLPHPRRQGSGESRSFARFLCDRAACCSQRGRPRCRVVQKHKRLLVSQQIPLIRDSKAVLMDFSSFGIAALLPKICMLLYIFTRYFYIVP